MSQEYTAHIAALVERGVKTRERLLELAETLPRAAGEMQLAPPSSLFEAARHSLADQDCTLVVTGSARQATTVWINDLIGRPLLPEGARGRREPRRQAFSVRNTPQTRYGLRFEDDSYWEITEADLTHYAAQAVAAPQGHAPAAYAGKPLRWVEIETPCAALPARVNLVAAPDTGPGLASSSEVMQRFILRAQGVVLVLGSDDASIALRGTLDEQQAALLDRVCRVTSQVLFLQALPAARTTGREEALASLTTLLRQRYGERLAHPPVVWPLSPPAAPSLSGTGAERPSTLYPDLTAALQLFRFRVATAARCSLMGDALRAFADVSRQTLEARRAATLATQRRQGDMPGTLRDMLRSLEQSMGPRAPQREALMESLRRECASARLALTQELSPTGSIAAEGKKRIDNADSAALEKMARNLPQDVADQAQALWNSVFLTLHDKLFRMASAYVDTQEKNTDWAKVLYLETDHEPISLPQHGLFDHLLQANAYGLGGATAISMATQAAAGSGIAGAGLLTLALPVVGITVGTAAALAALAYGLWKGATYSVNKALRESRETLHKKLLEYLQEIEKQFFDVKFTQGFEKCYVDIQFDALVADLDRQIARAYTNRRQELRTEIETLEAQAASPEEAARLAARAEDRLKAWESLEERLNATLRDVARMREDTAALHDAL